MYYEATRQDVVVCAFTRSLTDMPDNDYYETLRVARDATPEAIKKAYRGWLTAGPSRSARASRTAEKRFKQVQQAYDIL